MNDMALEYATHRFTVGEYHRMADAGVFPPDARIELIDGELVERIVTMKPPHAWAVEALDGLLRNAVGEHALVRCQLPVTLGDFSEPEPDFAIVCGPRTLYKTRHPNAEDIVALIEVSDSSRDFDVRRKVPIYASYAIPEVWVIDLIDRCLRTYRDPHAGEYRNTDVLDVDKVVHLKVFPEISIAVSAVLP